MTIIRDAAQIAFPADLWLEDGTDSLPLGAIADEADLAAAVQQVEDQGGDWSRWYVSGTDADGCRVRLLPLGDAC